MDIVLQHVAISAINFDEMMTFYKEVIGLEEIYNIKPSLGTRRGLLGSGNGGCLEIFSGGVEKVQHPVYESGYMHICFEVTSLEKKYTLLKNIGIQIISPLKKGQDGYYQFHILDPENNKVEFREKIEREIE